MDRTLALSWEEAWLSVVVATSIYVLAILLTRLFGQRQLTTWASYDLIFVFAIGSIIGRVILVRTSLGVAAVGLVTMFSLHAGAAWLHRHSAVAHRLTQNRPILLVAKGHILHDGLRAARVSTFEVHQQLRLNGHGSLAGVKAVILERSGTMSVIGSDQVLDPSLFAEVQGTEQLAMGPRTGPVDG